MLQAKWGVKDKRKLKSFLITNCAYKLRLYQAKQIFSLISSMVGMSFQSRLVHEDLQPSRQLYSDTDFMWSAIKGLGDGAWEGRVSISTLLGHLTLLSVPNTFCWFVLQTQRPLTSSFHLLERHKAGREVLCMNRRHETSEVIQQLRSWRQHSRAWCFNDIQAKGFRSK